MNVKAVIKERGWSIERLAAEIPNRNGEKGVSPITLHQNLSRNPTVDTLRKIADVIGCKVGDFFRDELTETAVHPEGCVCPVCGAHLRLAVVEADTATPVRNVSNSVSELPHSKGETKPEGGETAKKDKYQKDLAKKFLGGYLGDISKISKVDLDTIRIALDAVLEE